MELFNQHNSEDIAQSDDAKVSAKSYRSIHRAIRYTEWIILLMYFVLDILEQSQDNYSYEPLPFYFICIYFAIIAILSLIFPVNRPEWQRKLYIFIEIAVTMVMVRFGEAYNVLLYLFLAKSCFLFNRKQVIFSAIASIICWTIASLIYIPEVLEFQANGIDKLIDQFREILNNQSHLNLLVAINILNNTGIHLAATTFVFLLCSVTISEKRSRQRAEFLSNKVETLAANLERTRIAREIHDSLGHYLTGLDVQLELAQRIYQQDMTKAAESITIAKNLSSQCLTEVRRSVKTMRQSNFNLNEALETLVETIETNHHQINQTFSTQVNLNLPSLPVQTSHQIYCIIQEGITNIQKHANATLITLKGKQQENEIILELFDNGQGFNIASHHTGFGLRGMQERANILGGELKIFSTIGNGTTIQLWIQV